MGEWVLRERFATDAGEIAWDQLGQGPPVVMVHGTRWSSWTWRRVAPRLAERFTVYVFDLLGFGASDQRPGQDVSLAAHGARLAALIEFWGLDRPAVIAHDIGGAAALRAHLLHHRSVAALALIDGVALAPWGTPFYRLVRDHHTVFESLPTAIHEGVPGLRWDRAAAAARSRRRGRPHRTVARTRRAVGLVPADRPGRPEAHRRHRAAA